MFKRVIDENLHLELIAHHHVKELFELIDRNREHLKKNLNWVDGIVDVEYQENHIKGVLEAYANGRSITCTIFYKEKIAGVIDIFGIKSGLYKVKKGEIGYWLGKEFTSNGIMSKAVKQMCKIGFKYYNIDKIVIRCANNNPKSCNIAKRCGFTLEGTLREEAIANGTLTDVHIYSLLKREFIANLPNQLRQ